MTDKQVSNSLFLTGNFKLHAGQVTTFRIECDNLTDEDIDSIAKLIAERVDPFCEVKGVPRGGLRLAKALEKYCRHDREGLLIVDDVYTTGVSMQEAKSHSGWNASQVQGAVIFSRSPSTPPWIMPLFTLASSQKHKMSTHEHRT